MTLADSARCGLALGDRDARRRRLRSGVARAGSNPSPLATVRCAVAGIALMLATLARADPGYVARRTGDGVRIESREAPSGASGLDIPVKLKRLLVAGAFEDVEVADIAGRPTGAMTVADLLKIAAVLQARYADAGYFLARFYVPPQTIRPEGDATIACIDVEIEAIEIRQVPAHAAAPLRRHLAGLVGRGRLKRADYERAILLAERQLGLAVTAKPEPGSRADRVRLVIEGNGKAYAGEASFGALYSRPYRNAAGAASLSLASPFGLGERIYASGTFGRRWDEPQITGHPWGVVAGIEAPLGIGDTSLDVTGMHVAEHRRLDDFTVLDYRYDRLGWRFVAPVILSGTESLVLRLGPDVFEETQRYRYATVPPFVVELDDRVRLARLSAQWTRAFATGVQVDATVEASAGDAERRELVRIEDVTVAAAPSTAIGKVAGRLKLDIPVVGDMHLGIFARGQYAFLASLPPSEQIQLLQSSDAPGLDSETSEGDSGALFRTELGRPIALPAAAGASVTPYVFGAAGFVSSIPPFSGSRIVRGTSAGGGLRMTVPTPSAVSDGIDVSLELARVVTDGPTRDFTGLTGRVGMRF
jgi:hemolysin activation/secretion protein